MFNKFVVFAIFSLITLGTGFLFTSEATAKFKEGCMKVKHFRGNVVDVKNKCGAAVFFMWDGGGQTRVDAGNAERTIPSGNARFNITGRTYYWKYCLRNFKEAVPNRCASSKVYSKKSPLDYSNKTSCIKPVYERYDVQHEPNGGWATRLIAIKNKCNHKLNIMLAKGEKRSHCNEVTSEGDKVCRPKSNNRFSVSAGSKRNLPKDFILHKAKTLTEALSPAYNVHRITVFACSGKNSFFNAYAHIGKGLTGVCSLKSNANSPITRKVEHPNFN